MRPVEHVQQVPALDVLLDDDQGAAVDKAVQNGHQEGVRHLAADGDLVLEPQPQSFIRVLQVDDLDSDAGMPRGKPIYAFKDDGRAARVQFAKDDVAASIRWKLAACRVQRRLMMLTHVLRPR